MSLNKVMLIGRLGADPETRSTQSGSTVTNMSLATNRTWKSDNGKQEETEWHRIVAFGRTAEVCGEYLEKGRQIYVEGRIQTNEWEDRDGETQYTTEIVANNVNFLSGGGDAPSGGGGRPTPKPKQDESDDYDESFDDDDIPF